MHGVRSDRADRGVLAARKDGKRLSTRLQVASVMTSRPTENAPRLVDKYPLVPLYTGHDSVEEHSAHRSEQIPGKGTSQRCVA